jgi:hypothetical protein
MRHAAWVTLIVVCTGLVFFQVTVWLDLADDQKYLAHLMDTIDPTLPPSAQALALVAYLRDKAPQTNRSYFVAPQFAFLRPTARQVAQGGGNCADRSRFVVVMLKLRGIHASKWALYSPDRRPAHAVVEVDSELGKMVVDPLYGITFPKAQGGFYGIRDLRDTPGILESRIKELHEAHIQPGTLTIESYPLDRYVYSDSRTVNWDKSATTHQIYRLLYAISGDKINEVTRPEWSEQPADMVLLMTYGIEAVLLLAFLLFVFRRKRLK